MCFRLLQKLQLHLLTGLQLCATDSRTRLQQLQTLAHLLQEVEAMLRLQTQLQAAMLGWEEEVESKATDSCSLSFALVKSALSLLSRVAVPAAVATVQGQLLLQACTSLLLTCSSLLHAKQHEPTVPELAVCVELLGLLQPAQHQHWTAAGAVPAVPAEPQQQQPGVPASGSDTFRGVEEGATQSAAAGAALVGRYLVSIGATLTPPAAEAPSSAGSSSSGRARGQGSRDRLMSLHWLTASSSSSRLYLGPTGELEMGPGSKAPNWDQSRDVFAETQDLYAAADQLVRALGGEGADWQASSSSSSAADTSSRSTQSSSGSSGSSGSSSSSSNAPALRLSPSDAIGACMQLRNYIGKVQQGHTALHEFLMHKNIDTDIPQAARAATAALPAAFTAAGEALCAALPCSSCCNNPRCTSLRGVSAAFALVRGQGCVCGGCLGLAQCDAAEAPRAPQMLVAAR
jgi:hypothetical protein